MIGRGGAALGVRPRRRAEGPHQHARAFRSAAAGGTGQPPASRRLAQNQARARVAAGRHLRAKGAPAIAPLTAPPPGPYHRGDVGLTLWPLIAHRPADDADAAEGARTLRQLHEALADFPGTLPSFTQEFVDCTRRLSKPDAFPGLGRDDTGFIREDHARTRALLDARSYKTVPIHGDAHLKNLLITADGPRWCDLEAACSGPIEWDLVALPESARPAYGDWSSP
ncbi:MAG: hypothetical protein FJX54_01695 [Alphaproteobacteria bacterium]|nr:hypothetical protein [Alphaproteobacteria bacterium]